MEAATTDFTQEQGSCEVILMKIDASSLCGSLAHAPKLVGP
jgi:hypothetical protein